MRVLCSNEGVCWWCELDMGNKSTRFFLSFLNYFVFLW